MINEEKAQMIQNTEVVGIGSSVQETVAALTGIPTEEALTQMLREQILTVTFLKLDGEQRVMTCTKDMNFIPEHQRPTSSKPGKPGTVNVWDLTADAWRSFRYDRIQTVEPRTMQVQEVG